MTLIEFQLLIIFLFPLAYSPGPGNMFFAALGARYGVIATLPANLGYHLATLIVSFAIGMGFSIVLDPVSTTFMLIQKFGAVYILWLAWKLYRSHGDINLAPAQAAGPMDGMILLLNPKGYLIMALMFLLFPSANMIGTASVATLFTLNNMLAFLVWTMAGQTLARIFNSPRAAHRLNTGFALCLAGVALWLLIG
ncbi:hypothetical protein JI58_10390 [Marinosulfonomonas sp. PRT-SC04]|nr:hypothetical protein JI58_10390 [Marinosulfonomonas sp. PRT-SC04]